MNSHEELCFSTRKQDAKEKIIEWHLLKHGKKDFFQGGTTLIGTETTVMEFRSGRERLGSTMNTHGQVGIYSPGEGWCSLDVKLLTGISRARERVPLNCPNRIPREGRPGWSHITWGWGWGWGVGVGWGEESVRIQVWAEWRTAKLT